MQVLNVVFGIVLTFCLNSEDYGMMAVLSIYSAIAASLQDSGFVAALTNKSRPTHRDYNSVFWFNITCSAVIYAILWFCAPLIADYNHDLRLIPLSRYTFIGFFVASFSKYIGGWCNYIVEFVADNVFKKNCSSTLIALNIRIER